MNSRQAKRAGFAGVAASSFRKAGIAAILSVVASSPALRAQALPGSGVGAASGLGGGAATGLGTAAAAPVAAPRTIWSFLGLSANNLHACKEKLCASQFGQMLNSLATGPVGAVSGGFIPPLCPPAPSPAQIAGLEKKPNGGAEAAAAKIKASEADAKARVAAVEYLGTVDCNRFPEAKKGLISALREDPNECVRYAAARALNSGCCCDQEVIEALKECVAGESKKAPAETSPRVKAAAFAALQNCLMKVPEEVEAPAERAPARPEGLPEALPDTRKRAKPEGTTMNTSDPSTRVTSLGSAAPPAQTKGDDLEQKPFGQTVAEARRTLFEAARYPQPPSTLPSGKRSLYHAFVKARQDMDAKARQQQNLPRPPRDPGVEPSSYEAPSGNPPSRRDLNPAQPQPSNVEDGSSGETATSEASPASDSPAKRGLFGLLLKPRNPG
jgi:hypothetical protein